MSRRKNSDPSDAAINDALGVKPWPDEDGSEAAAATAQQDRMALARAERANGIRDGRQRTPNLLYVVECDGEGRLARVVKAFDNKYRLRKWISVAADIDPTLPGRVVVVRGKRLTLTEVIE